MCLVTSPPKRDSYVVHERGPRPVSNYHGGPRHSHNSVRRTSYVPAERVSYRSSHRSIPHSHRDYTRTSRTQPVWKNMLFGPKMEEK